MNMRYARKKRMFLYWDTFDKKYVLFRYKTYARNGMEIITPKLLKV